MPALYSMQTNICRGAWCPTHCFACCSLQLPCHLLLQTDHEWQMCIHRLPACGCHAFLHDSKCKGAMQNQNSPSNMLQTLSLMQEAAAMMKIQTIWRMGWLQLLRLTASLSSTLQAATGICDLCQASMRVELIHTPQRLVLCSLCPARFATSLRGTM